MNLFFLIFKFCWPFGNYYFPRCYEFCVSCIMMVFDDDDDDEVGLDKWNEMWWKKNEMRCVCVWRGKMLLKEKKLWLDYHQNIYFKFCYWRLKLCWIFLQKKNSTINCVCVRVYVVIRKIFIFISVVYIIYKIFKKKEKEKQ